MTSSMMPMSEKVQHAGMVGNDLVCNRCGSRYTMGLPMPIFLMTATVDAWAKEHKNCKGERSALREATSLQDWAKSDDTGLSSRAIYSHFTNGYRSTGDHPWDPADFGRCYRLLQLAPEWESRIIEMAKYSNIWARLALAWPELKALYEEEVPAGTCPKLYARMKELISGKPVDRTQEKLSL